MIDRALEVLATTARHWNINDAPDLGRVLLGADNDNDRTA